MESGGLRELGNPQNLGVCWRGGGKGVRRVEGDPQVSGFGNWKISEYQEQSWSRCVRFEVSTGFLW